MTRKRYIRKMQVLILAINKWAQEHNQPCSGGQAFKHFREHVKETPKMFGSYQKAWDFLKRTRETFGVD